MAGRGGSVRIIGGEWRGRRLRFPAAPGLRPTADRRRETLFNWLAPGLVGATCLDLFAGSGALGFEAASRGAARVVMVEAARPVARALAASREGIGADAVDIRTTTAERYLGGGAGETFDVVFIDPPFARPELAARACERLTAGWLAPGARVYVEYPAHADTPAVPVEWSRLRATTGGDARGLLLEAP